MLQRSVHLGLGLGVCFLVFPLIKKPKNEGQEKLAYILGFIFTVISLVCCFFEMSDPMRQIAPQQMDFILGTVMFVLVSGAK